MATIAWRRNGKPSPAHGREPSPEVYFVVVGVAGEGCHAGDVAIPLDGQLQADCGGLPTAWAQHASPYCGGNNPSCTDSSVGVASV